MPGSVGPAVRLVDARGGRHVDRTRDRAALLLTIDHRRLSGGLGFTPQRPRKRATERHEPTVQRWLEHDYPAIVKRATTEDADIHWGDECGVSNQANYGRSFAPRGQTPVIPRPATRFTCSMISTLTNLGTLRFMIFEGA